MSGRRLTAGVILAAGMSRRLGRPKQLIPLEGKLLIEHVLDAALASRLDAVFLVLGDRAPQIFAALGAKLKHPRLHVVVNKRYSEGLSSSLHAGLQKARRFASVMFLLGDQPRVTGSFIDLLIDRFQASEKEICVPVYRGKRGNPTLFGQSFYGALMALSGDIGARELIASNSDRVLEVEVQDPGVFLDIDTASDLKLLAPFSG